MKKFLIFILIMFSVVSFSNYYYGNLHSHTAYSDGTADPQTAFNHAKNSGVVDFLAVSDHARDLIFATQKGEDKFDRTLEEAKEFSDESFLGLRSFEWTRTGIGHITMYDTDSFIYTGTGDLLGVYQWLIVNNGIANFCHPKERWGLFSDFNYYPLADKHMCMIEVGNSRSPTSDTITDIYFNNYIVALNKGWHLAPIMSQDNHEADWGTANVGRTVFIMDELSEEAIYDAMRNRRVYASEDLDAQVMFYTDNNIMGEIIYDETEANFKIDYSDPGEDIDTIYLYSSEDLKIYYPKKGETHFEIPVKTEKDFEWYFVKIVQHDDNEIVTAPIWLQNSEKKYLFTPETVEEMQIEGSPYKLTFNLVNMNFKEKEFVVSIRNESGEEISLSRIPVEAYSKKLAEVEINDTSEKLFFFMDDTYTTNLSVDFKAFSLKVDTSHENNFRSMLKAMEDFAITEGGLYEKIRNIKEQSLMNTSILLIPFPDVDSFMPDFGKLKDEEIDLITKKISDENLKVILVFDTKNGTLPSSVASFNELIRINNGDFIITEDGKSLIENAEKSGPKQIEIITFDGKSYEDILSGISLK